MALCGVGTYERLTLRPLRAHVEIQTEEDLLPPGAAPGTVPTDLEQATGLDRLEILGKMQGIDVFDMKPLDASRKGRLAILCLSRALVRIEGWAGR